MISLDTNSTSYEGAVIKVIGVGGGGGNAINNMIKKGLTGVDFIAANTDRQALEHNLAPVKVQIGKNHTKGLGAGANPEVGRTAVEESKEAIKQTLLGSDMIFVTSGLGGGTGTGGAPMIAEIGQELGALVVAIVTKPFDWEGPKRKKIADKWLEELRTHVDALIVISNQRLLEIIDKNTTFTEAFLMVDEVLYNATKGISDIINNHGVVNVDFADVQTIMKGMGDSIMGIGRASGENRAIEATKAALNSPILDGVSIAGAKGLLVNISGNLTMFEISEAVSMVQEAAGEDALLIHGIVPNADLGDEIMITVVATGFNKDKALENKKIETNENQNQQNPTNNDLNKFNQLNTANNNNFERNLERLKVGGSGFREVPFLNKIATHYDQKPHTDRELKAYDEPTIFRKKEDSTYNESIKKVPLGEQGFAQIEKLRESAKPVSEIFAEKHNRVINSEPTFLRKIMD